MTMTVLYLACLASWCGAMCAQHCTIRALMAQGDTQHARYDSLVKEMVAMRQTGFTAAKPAKVIEPKDEESTGLAQMEASTMARRRDLVFIENAAEDMMRRTGVTKAQAIQEAARMRKEMNEQEDSPL